LAVTVARVSLVLERSVVAPRIVAQAAAAVFTAVVVAAVGDLLGVPVAHRQFWLQEILPLLAALPCRVAAAVTHLWQVRSDLELPIFTAAAVVVAQQG
jgi:hypothetical protein